MRKKSFTFDEEPPWSEWGIFQNNEQKALLLIIPWREAKSLGSRWREYYKEGVFRTEEKGNSFGWQSDEPSGLGLLWPPPHRFPISSLPVLLSHCVYLFQFYFPKVQCSDVTFLLKAPSWLIFTNDSSRLWTTWSQSDFPRLLPSLLFTHWPNSAVPKNASLIMSFSLISYCQWLLVFQDPSSRHVLLKPF